jgi:hypothetical protein
MKFALGTALSDSSGERAFAPIYIHFRVIPWRNFGMIIGVPCC